ncbi:MAG: PilZ domain-containing protein [Gammaproteobacteria bacterium]
MAADKNRKSAAKSTTRRPELYEVFETRRKYPRIIIDVPVSIRKSKGVLVEAMAHDISIDGLQIRCNRDSAGTLHPSGKFIQENNGPKVEVSFPLSFDEGIETVEAVCQIYYLAVIPGDEIAFGLAFKKFKGNSAGLVDRFIMDYIVPVDDKVRSFLDEPHSHHEILEHMKMETNEVEEVLNRLKIKGDVISYEDSSMIRHLKLSSAVASIFNKLKILEERLGKIEKTLDKK